MLVLILQNALDQYLKLETTFFPSVKKLPGPDPYGSCSPVVEKHLLRENV